LANDGIDEDLGIHAKGVRNERSRNTANDLLRVELDTHGRRAKKVTLGSCKIAVPSYLSLGPGPRIPEFGLRETLAFSRLSAGPYRAGRWDPGPTDYVRLHVDTSCG
jgi:hypothetical protein